MELNFDSHTIALPCGSCSQEFTETIGWFKQHRSFTCTKCNALNAVDLTKFDQGVAKAQVSVDEFEAVLRKIGKR